MRDVCCIVIQLGVFDISSLFQVPHQKGKKIELGSKGGRSLGLSNTEANKIAVGGFEVVCIVMQRCTHCSDAVCYRDSRRRA